MISPSWPSQDRNGRSLASPRIRRRADAAQRRAMRSAVGVGGLVVAVVIAAAALRAAAIEGHASVWTVAVHGAEIGVALLVTSAARRGVRWIEPLAMSMLVTIVAGTLIHLALTSTIVLVATAELAILVVAAALFLPWSLRWHAAWLVTAASAAVAFWLLPISSVAPMDRAGLALGVTMAALTSLVGHIVWQARFRGMLEQQFELRALSRHAQRQELRVRELNRELNRAARVDSLTGVGNRLALEEALAHLLDQGTRVRPQRFALAIFDIDHFKDYNDKHGHLAGDAALDRMGEVLRRETRGADMAFRYGGEEFVLLLPQVDLTGAIAAAERVRAALDESGPGGGAPGFTISGGVALCDPADGRDPAPLLRRADAALYLAKRAGRDRIAADELSVAMQRREIASA